MRDPRYPPIGPLPTLGDGPLDPPEREGCRAPEECYCRECHEEDD